MNICHYRNEALENIAKRVILQYDRRLLIRPAPTPVEDIIEKTYGLTLEYQFIRNNGRILGETVFEDAMIPVYDKEDGKGYTLVSVKGGTVIIDAGLLDNKGSGRFRYTCAHELAHYVIHRQFYTQIGETAAMTKIVKSSESDRHIERQADRLAGYLLMPKGTVKSAFFNNQQTKGDITAFLAGLFQVSRQAMDIRLREMRLI